MKTATIWVILAVIVIIIVILIIALVPSQPPMTTDTANTDANSPAGNAYTASMSTSTATSTTSTSDSNPMVTMTDSGFSPSPITVDLGDTVTFVNNSSGPMWVASNPHPTHTDLPGFDEKASVAPGGSWTYIFTVPGQHGYHNHRNPTLKGQVVVQ